MKKPIEPSWASELRERYIAGEASMFLLHGNVNDLYPWQQSSAEKPESEQAAEEAKTTFLDLPGFLQKLLRKKDFVLHFELSGGIRLRSPREKRLLEARLRQADISGKVSTGSPFDIIGIADALQLIERLLQIRDLNLAVVVEYMETIVPMSQLHFMSEEERMTLVRLLQWTADERLSTSDNILVMVTENLSEVHKRFVSRTQMAIVDIPLPETELRQLFTDENCSGVNFVDDMNTTNFSQVCAGLTLSQMSGILRMAKQTAEPVSFETVSLRKKSIIEQECQGLVEFVAPKHDFSHVGGMRELKSELMRITHAIKSGQRNQVPMGMLFVGPMGTGKTFVAEAFAGESGLTCLKFKNFRERWVGSTEANLEKILQVVKGLGYVLLIIDEADRSMSGQGDNDGGTSSRVIARLKEFMSDTAHRGRVLVVMMTNRPDKIDIDLKRPGRLDFKIPFFFPQDDETRGAILNALIRKNKLSLTEDANPDHLVSELEGYSGAELESVLLRAMRLAAAEDRESISSEDLTLAVADVIPSRDTRMLEYMELLAVFEASSRQMLPQQYRLMTPEQVQSRLDQLRAMLGRRI